MNRRSSVVFADVADGIFQGLGGALVNSLLGLHSTDHHLVVLDQLRDVVILLLLDPLRQEVLANSFDHLCCNNDKKSSRGGEEGKSEVSERT